MNEHDDEDHSVVTAETIWSFDDPGFDLTVEEQLFCRSYIIDRNPVAALNRLNYAGDNAKLKAIAKKFLSRVEVAECVETLAKRMMEKLDVTAERVQRKIAAAAFFDLREVMQFDSRSVNVIDSKFWTEEQAAAIQSVKVGKEGIEIKLYDRLRAAEMLSKQLGTLPEDDPLAAARAMGDEVVKKLFEVFDRTVPEPETQDDLKRLN